MKAIITGITGQDGSYLAELLLEKGYEVHGIMRRSSTSTTERIDHLLKDKAIKLHAADLCDLPSLIDVFKEVQPDEVYNLAAQSHVGESFKTPVVTGDITGLGVTRVLEAIRKASPESKFYQASSSEMFGKVQEVPQTEKTPFHPRSPYGVAKVYGYWITVNYREGYDMHASNGILFNHESPRRGENFVTKKITLAISRISKGLQEDLELGNIDSKRDWGHAKDYVNAMWLMLQQNDGDDYVVATGEQHSVREFVEIAADHVGMNISWEGKGLDEVGIDKKTGKKIIKINPEFYRPAEVDTLLGDSSYTEKTLGWKMEYSFEDLVREMVEEDLRVIVK